MLIKIFRPQLAYCFLVKRILLKSKAASEAIKSVFVQHIARGIGVCRTIMIRIVNV